MNIPGFSTNGLLMMHGSIKNALAIDDAHPDDQDKLYGVRLFSDWRRMADQIESELTARHVKFQPVQW